MNSNDAFRNYKHDITGKFKDISTAISSMDESTFNNSENNEILHAVHEVLLKMVKTSRDTIIENLKQEIILVVTDQQPNLRLSKLQIGEVTVRYEQTNDYMKYYYHSNENKGKFSENVATIGSFLPVRSIQVETNDAGESFT